MCEGHTQEMCLEAIGDEGQGAGVSSSKAATPVVGSARRGRASPARRRVQGPADTMSLSGILAKDAGTGLRGGLPGCRRSSGCGAVASIPEAKVAAANPTYVGRRQPRDQPVSDSQGEGGRTPGPFQ